MDTITSEELERDPLAQLNRVEAGERLLVVRNNRPVAELCPVSHGRNGPRPFGLCAGEFTVPADFDAPLPEEILREFEGR